MQRLGLMRIMKRQRIKYEEFESIYPVTIYHKTIPWIYNSCHFLSFRDRIIEKISNFFIIGTTNGERVDAHKFIPLRSVHPHPEL